MKTLSSSTWAFFRPGQHGGQLGLFGIGLADLPVEPGDILADAGLLRASVRVNETSAPSVASSSRQTATDASSKARTR